MINQKIPEDGDCRGMSENEEECLRIEGDV
jgi:hypothetical protein